MGSSGINAGTTSNAQSSISGEAGVKYDVIEEMLQEEEAKEAERQYEQKKKEEEQKKREFEECFHLDPPPQVIVVYQGGGQSLVKRLQDRYPEAAIIGGVVM